MIISVCFRQTKDILASEFRDVRGMVFGRLDNRKMIDFRPSGAVEAIVGRTAVEGQHPRRFQRALSDVPANEATLQ
jgi:hypothetical protein